MTPKNEQRDEKEGILEQMLRSLRSIGQNVERIVYWFDFYNTGAGRKNDDEWQPEDLCESGEY
jgi:hypothetical protein